MDNMPDFDKMSPEEINKWLETLAKRQGATEGLVSSADMDIAEIDPNSVVIDEPGYVPYGQEGKMEPIKPGVPKAAAPPPPKPAPEPVKPVEPPAAEPQRPAARVITPPPTAAPLRPATSAPPAPPAQPPTVQQPAPARPAAAQLPPAPAATRSAPPAQEGGLAWLESLAGGNGGEDDSLFNLDLSNLSTEDSTPAAAAPEAGSSLSWLEDLARTQDDPLAQPAPARDPFGGSDSVEWLESLARRQGADTEELLTPAQLDIPMPELNEIEAPGYVAFSFDTPPVTNNRAPAPTLSDPSDFLSSLADDAPPAPPPVAAVAEDESGDEMSMDSIQRALADGSVTREQIQVLFEAKVDEIVNEPDMVMPELDEEPALVPAELPDWLLEQMGGAPAEPPAAPQPTASLDALFPPTPVSEDMPDWLKEEAEPDDQPMDFGSLFTETAEPVAQVASAPAAGVEVDPDDTWAEAFDLEHQAGTIDVAEVPDWYERNVSDPARIAAVEKLEQQDDELIDEPLPAEDLPVGEAQGLPSWMAGTELPVAAEPEVVELAPAEPAFADWLSELENPEAVEVPDWLTETAADLEPAAFTFEPEPEPEPVYVPPVAQRPVPPPTTAAPLIPRAPVSAGALQSARDLEQSGDLEGSLSEYEGLIRASVDIDTVVADLEQMVKSYRTVPAVYRVLGDGLMRQGKLQDALNTYREALNQL